MPDTDSPLSRLCSAASLDLPRLALARAATQSRLARRREMLAALNLPPGFAVVFLGSWGRAEVTDRSDNDFLLLTPTAPEDDFAAYLSAIAEVLLREEAETRGADVSTSLVTGQEGVFGQGVVAL